VRTTFLPYCAPSIGEEEINEVLDTLRSGFLSTGPKVRLFEDNFAEYVGAKHAIALNSCTAALEIALAALQIGPGDEVIVPTMTFCATANVVEHRGATTVLVDIGENLQIKPEAVASAISERTRAIIPVHYGGQACDLEAILRLAENERIEVIQDAAHAAGAVYRTKKIGSHGRLTAFSFYPSKNMTTGEGGMLTTNDAVLAARLRELALHGIRRNAQSPSEQNQSWEYEVTEPGYKANMPEMQAAIGIQQLKKLDQFVERRREIAHRYTEAFSDLEGLVLPGDLPDRMHVYHLYTLRVTSEGFDQREFMQDLRAANIGASVHFVPLHRHPHYRNKYRYAPDAFPVADALFRCIASIPLYPGMSDKDVDDVIAAVRGAVLKLRAPALGCSAAI
jgi:dTDP-4-amino-4,6-dideoxygalactose transaminase